MSGTDGSISPPLLTGFAPLAGNVNLQPTASNEWVDTGLFLTLPTAGLYHIDASVRCALNATSDVNTYIRARLWNVTDNVEVPHSIIVPGQIVADHGALDGAMNFSKNDQGTIVVELSVPHPTIIRLEAARGNQTGASNAASIIRVGTNLRFLRVGI